jgi:hypothetical protein
MNPQSSDPFQGGSSLHRLAYRYMVRLNFTQAYSDDSSSLSNMFSAVSQTHREVALNRQELRHACSKICSQQIREPRLLDEPLMPNLGSRLTGLEAPHPHPASRLAGLSTLNEGQAVQYGRDLRSLARGQAPQRALGSF